MTIRAMRGTIIVEPIYDLGGRVPAGTPYHATNVPIEGQVVYGMVIPATGENPESQQGTVVASGIDEFSPGMLAIYMPYHGLPISIQGHQYLCIPDRELAGWLDGRDIHPRKGWLLIHPEWPAEKVGSLYLPEYSGLHEPVAFGRVIAAGAYTTLSLGTRVVIPLDHGFEIGVAHIGENLYLLNEQHIPAIIETHRAYEEQWRREYLNDFPPPQEPE